MCHSVEIRLFFLTKKGSQFFFLDMIDIFPRGIYNEKKKKGRRAKLQFFPHFNDNLLFFFVINVLWEVICHIQEKNGEPFFPQENQLNFYAVCVVIT